MELDELRRQWQQPDPAAPPVSPTQLQGLLVRRSTGLVEKMRRNARLEAIFAALVAFGLPFFINAQWAHPLYRLYQLYGVMLMLLAMLMLYYYYRQLQLLQRMVHAEVHVRAHLGTLCAGLRRQLKFYYRLTLATGPVMLLMVMGFDIGLELARTEAFRWGRLGLIAGLMLVFGGLLQIAIVYGTRWYMQKLYGQHLDRLESSLRELSDESSPPKSA